ncbi:MAG: nucleotidyltransferase family protein [Acidobacteriota bacterium]
MRPGMHWLLRLLRGQARWNDAPETEWMKVLDLAEQENVLPWAATRLRAQLDNSASPFAARLERVARNARVFAFLWSATLRSTLAEFHHRSIPVLSLKGPWMAHRLYGDASLKLYSDLDLLVHRQDIARAESLLVQLGFHAKERRDDYHRPWHREGLRIELHHDVENPLAFDFRVEDAWGRAVPAAFDGVPARLLSPPDELLFLCLHSVRHRFERLSHVLDLLLAFHHFGDAVSAAAKCAPAAQRVLTLGAIMASRLDPRFAVPAEFARTSDYTALERLADSLWEERMQQPAPALDWKLQHRFYLALETRPWDRLFARFRHLRILATRLIEPDFAFAARFHLDRSWQVWLVRPIRLLRRSAMRPPADPRWSPENIHVNG